MRSHKNKPFRTVAIAGQCAAAQILLFEELTGSFICDFPDTPLKGVYYYKFNEYLLTCLPPGSPADAAAEYDCVIYLLHPFRLETDLVDALRFSRKAKRFVLLMCRFENQKKKRLPSNLKLLSGALRAEIVLETCHSSKGVNRLLDSIGKLFS